MMGTQSRDSRQRPFCTRLDIGRIVRPGASRNPDRSIAFQLGWNTEGLDEKDHVAQTHDESLHNPVRRTPPPLRVKEQAGT
jgi:hypothetical protein